MNRSRPADKQPLVTIGMPIYNEARYLEHALQSLLAQNYDNFQILISDNASTDGTSEIGERFANQNERVTYSRTETNIGAAGNFQRVLAMANGKYFMWAAGHDQWSPNLVSECVDKLEANSGAAIAVATSHWMDESGARMQRDVIHYDTRGMNFIQRFLRVFWGNMHPVLGLTRLDYLKRTRGMQAFAGSDLVLLSELVLMGDFIHVQAASWNRREFRPTESHDERMQRYTSKEYGQATSTLDRWFPLLRLPFGLIRAVWSAHLSWLHRIGLLLALLPVLPVRYVAGRRKAARS